MSGETIVAIVGNLVAPAELKFVPSGAAVASFTIASTPRVFKDEAWSDGPTLFMRCSAWRELAENIAESLTTKGTKVIAQGRLTQRSFETREGEKRTVVELEVDAIGPDLSRATAKVTRSQRQDAPNPACGQPFSDRRSQPTPASQAAWDKSKGGAADDPWATPATRPMTSDTEPPF